MASPTHVSRALDVCRGFRLTHCYGPTECTTFACTYELRPGQFYPEGRVPIGRPISNTDVYVVGDDGRLLADGEVGELWIGGNGVALGYLGNAEATKAKFVPDGFTGYYGSYLYRSGDDGRWLAEGVLEFHGRRDQQVKIRGFRVELGEVESVLAEHALVGVAAVVSISSRTGVRILQAWVVGKNGKSINARGWQALLRHYLRERLPEAWVPTSFATLDGLPLKASGKVDRRALEALGQVEASLAEEKAEAETTTEAALLKLCRQLLPGHQLGPTSRLSDHGADSLWRVGLIEELRRAGWADIPWDGFLRWDTVRNWGCWLDALDRKAPAWPHEQARLFFLGWATTAELELADRWLAELRVPGVDALEDFVSIEEVAGRCLEPLRRLQPKGPYFLAGFSWGSLVIFELARILRDAGEDVRWLAIVDQEPPMAAHRVFATLVQPLASIFRMSPSTETQMLNHVGRAANLFHDFLGAGPSAILRWMHRKVKKHWSHSEHSIAITKTQKPVVESSEDRIARRMLARWKSYLKYSPKPLDIEVCLITSSESLEAYPTVFCAWTDLTTDLRHVTLPGNHSSIWRDRQALQQVLAYELARFQEFKYKFLPDKNLR